MMFCKPLKKDNKVITIVDGYSVASFYAQKLTKLGYQCVHIQSAPRIPNCYVKSFRPFDYIENLIYDGKNIKKIISKLNSVNTFQVMAGTESGVELADLISEKMHLLSNGTHCSEARRNKYKMIERLKKNHLPAVEHIKSNKVDVILKWAHELNSKPVVLKPLRSAGTEKVFFCHSEKDIPDAFSRILNTYNALGELNTEVLAESYLEGVQYLVNMVSVDGSHILSDLWEMAKKEIPGASIAHDYLKLLPCTLPIKDDLVEYTRQTLDALEIRYGASHNEVFWTTEGPILVEMAARIMGAVNPELLTECVGRSQMDLNLACYLQKERFSKNDLRDYHLKKHLIVKFIISSKEGIIKKINYLDEIKSLISFADIKLNAEIGMRLAKTIDLFTAAGTITLCHPDESIVQNDFKKIVELEPTIFEVE